MSFEIEALTALTRDIQGRLALEDLLQVIVDRAAMMLNTPRVSVRLLDPTRTQLVAIARFGAPLHEGPTAEFRPGEGLIGWIAEHAQPIRTGDAESDPRFAARPGIGGSVGSFLGVPLMSGSACMGVLVAINPGNGYFTKRHEALLVLLAGICAPHVEIARLARLAHVDPLTGALNRRGLDLAFPEVEGPADGVVRPLSVALADVDRFKLVNDEHGHAVGDEVLRAVARLLSTVLRAGDAIVRYGGEEFLLVLPSVGVRQAARIAERARGAVEAAPIAVVDVPVRATISVGVAERRPDEARTALIARADAALYAAKHAGRNRVETAR